MMPQEFTITEQHLKLLQRFYVGWQNCETGAPEIDPKRPYGNSEVAEDIAEILEITMPDPDVDEAKWNYMAETLLRLHRETDIALQICLATASFQTGTYERSEKYNDRSWKRVTP